MANTATDIMKSGVVIPKVSSADLGMGDNDLNSVLAGAQAQDSAYSSKITPIAKKISDISTKMGDEATPKIPELTKVPEQHERSPMEAFGSSAGWLAAFGGLLTRRPLTNSLNAASGVMNAYKQQDADTYQKQMEIWKAENDNAIKMFDMQNSQYKNIMDKYKGQTDALNTEAGIYGKMYKDTTMQQMAQMKLADQHLKTQMEYSNKLESTQQLLKDAEELHAARLAAHPEWTDEQKAKDYMDVHQQALNKSAATAAAKNDVAQTPTWSKEAIDTAVDGIHKGLTASQVGLGYGDKANRAAVYNALADKYPNSDLAAAKIALAEEAQEARSLGARTAPAKVAVKEMDKLAQPMIDAVKKLDPSQYPDLNSLNNAIDKKTGGPEIVAAAQAVQEFKTAFTNLMVRNGVATDQARSKADELIDKNFSLSQIEAVRDQAKISGAAVLDALAEAKGDLTNRSGSGNERINVITADGKHGTIDKAHLDEFLKDGGRVAE